MSFLQPQFFWALLALSIPLLIHLFNFRRYKTIYFSNTAFLQKLERNTRNINRLRHWLILAARMLAIAALVTAFAQPFLAASGNANAKPQFFSLYLDNSYSMGLNGPNGPLLNQSRQQAASLLEQLPEYAQVQIITNELGPKSSRFYRKNEALKLIDEITVSAQFRNFSTISDQIEDAWGNLEKADSAQLAVFVFSDLQESALQGIEAINEQKQWQLKLVPAKLANAPNNIAIDSIWFTRPVFKENFEQVLKVKLRNYTANEVSNLAISLNLNGENTAVAQVSIPAKNSAESSLFFTPAQTGLYQGEISLSYPDPDFDNRFYFSFSTQNNPSVSLIGKGLEEAKVAQYFPEAYFKTSQENIENVNYSALANQSLTVVETNAPPSSGLLEALQKSLANGNNVMLFPGQNEGNYFQDFLQVLAPSLQSTRKRDSLSGSKIFYTNPYFEQVFTSQSDKPSLPNVYQHFALSSLNLKPLVNLENGDPLLAYLPTSQGDLFLSSTALNSASSTLAQHPILAPVLINAALFQGSQPRPYLRAGNAQDYQFFNLNLKGAGALRVKLPLEENIPPQRQMSQGFKVFSPPRLPKPGNYPLTWQDSTVAHLALNVDARESDLNYLEPQALLSSFNKAQYTILEANNPSNFGMEYKQLYEGRVLWPWFIGLTLFFLVIEMLLIKFWQP
jgi:hypothetical protein